MKISRRLFLNQIFFIGTFFILIGIEALLYFKVRGEILSFSGRAANILETRINIITNYDRYMQAIQNSRHTYDPFLFDKLLELSNELNTIISGINASESSNELAKSIFNGLKIEYSLKIRQEESLLNSIERQSSAHQLPERMIESLISIQKAKRALANDIITSYIGETLNAVNRVEALINMRYFAVGLFTILVMIGAAMSRRYIRKNIIAPLGMLSESLSRFAKGDHHVKIPYAAADEIGAVISNFRHMQEHLNEADRKQQEAVKRLEEFTYIAAHDLRSPIASIDGYLLIAGEENDLSDDERRSFIKRARAVVTRSLNMLESLLSYARTANKQPNIELLDVSQACKDVLEDLNAQIKSTDAHISLHNLTTLRADPQTFHELLLNLVGNSLKYRRPGTRPELSLWQNRRNINGTCYDEICITDNGIGFDINQKDEMLKPFNRLSSASGYEGSGLGLTVCNQIMKNHKGYLDFSSMIGVGSTFSALFPT